MKDVMLPAPSLLVKLGSLAVHVDEFLSPHGHPVDRAAISTILTDADVRQWLEGMGKLGFLPVKRNL